MFDGSAQSRVSCLPPPPSSAEALGCVLIIVSREERSTITPRSPRPPGDHTLCLRRRTYGMRKRVRVSGVDQPSWVRRSGLVETNKAKRGHARPWAHRFKMSQMSYFSLSSESQRWAHYGSNAPGIIVFLLLLLVTLRSHAETKLPFLNNQGTQASQRESTWWSFAEVSISLHETTPDQVTLLLSR